MKKDTQKLIIVVVILCLVIMLSKVYSSFHAESGKDKGADGQVEVESTETPEAGTESAAVETKAPEAASGTRHLRDVKSLYEDNGDTYVTMYLTVRKGNATEGTNYSWEEVNSHSAYYYNEQNIDRFKAEVLLQVGDETGPLPGLLGYGKTTPNATIQIRGQTSSRNAQKNYKIELKQNQGSWKGQTTIALNKHMTDGLRFRNKLGFDLLSGIEQLMSLRTTFVHLYVNDLTDGSDDGFQDYGLYTQVEQLNKAALRTHGLDKNGQLYKVNFFEFYRYEDVIINQNDSGYDKSLFENYLEIKGDTDHSKLISMLDDLNDYTIPIDEIIEKNFDVENLCYWMAFNLLTGNADTQSRNVYLYSAQNKKIWYLYPWDLDGMFRYDENELKNHSDYMSWERGVSNYWGNILFQRCLKSQQFRTKLDEAVEFLKSYLSRDRISGLIKEYEAVTVNFTYRDPDLTYAPLTQEEYNEIAAKLPDLVDKYYGYYRDSLEKPLPFYIDTPVIEEEEMRLRWEASYDFQDEDITYHAIISRNPDGSGVLGEYTGKWTEATTALLEPGQYFLKVYATDESGNTQDAFDTYVVDGYGKYYGVICFYINDDGTLSRYVAEE